METNPSLVILGPGHGKIYFQIGVLRTLHERGYLANVDHYVGVSTSAILALLYLLDYAAEELAGFFRSQDLLGMLPALIRGRMGILPTFSQLYLFTGKQLTVTCLNVTTQEIEYFSMYTAPSLLVMDALLLATTLPGMAGEAMEYHGSTYMDAGLAHPYPVDAFDDGETAILGIAMPTYIQANTGRWNRLDIALHHIMRLVRNTTSLKVRHLFFEVAITTFGQTSLVSETEAQERIGYGSAQAKEFLEQVPDLRHHLVVRSTYPAHGIHVDPHAVPIIIPPLPTITQILSELIAQCDKDDDIINVLHTMVECMRHTNDRQAVGDLMARLSKLKAQRP